MAYYTQVPPPKEYSAKPSDYLLAGCRCGYNSTALEHCAEMVRKARYELDEILDFLAPPLPVVVHPCNDPPPPATRPRPAATVNVQSRGEFKFVDSAPSKGSSNNRATGSVHSYQLESFNPVELLRLSGRNKPDRAARGRSQKCSENEVTDCLDLDRLIREITVREGARGCGPRETNSSFGKECGEYTTECDKMKYNCRRSTVEHQREDWIDECSYYLPKQIRALNVLRRSNRYADKARMNYKYWEPNAMIE